MSKLQSAMEYLMTYGWAILIIAVVLGALFQLGIFNASTFTPKAPPGACHVFRPNGPMTTSFINLQGICNGELPQYVGVFSGTNSYISLGNIAGTNNYWSIAFWTRTSTLSPLVQYPIGFNGIGGHAGIFIADTNDCGQTACIGVYDGFSIVEGSSTATNTWYNVAVSKSGTTYNLYVNGAFVKSGTMTNLPLNQVFFASRPDAALLLHGMLANMQIYNSTISANEIGALYNEGLGGAPIALSSLVGWWPLNGDAKDYSGNNNNGVPTGISFSSSWQQGYSAP